MEREVFQKAQAAFDMHRQGLTVGDKPAMSPDIHANFASNIDLLCAEAISRYLPSALQFCRSKSDAAGVIAGLHYSGEITNIPEEVLPFLTRGIWFAALLVAEDPNKAREIVASVNEIGYPSSSIKDSDFRRPNRFGEDVTCAGILSGVAALRVFLNDEDRVQQLHYIDETVDVIMNRVFRV